MQGGIGENAAPGDQIERTQGTRAFAVNIGSTVWQNIGATPPPEPFTRSASVSTIQ